MVTAFSVAQQSPPASDEKFHNVFTDNYTSCLTIIPVHSLVVLDGNNLLDAVLRVALGALTVDEVALEKQTRQSDDRVTWEEE